MSGENCKRCSDRGGQVICLVTIILLLTACYFIPPLIYLFWAYLAFIVVIAFALLIMVAGFVFFISKNIAESSIAVAEEAKQLGNEIIRGDSE